MIKITFTVPGNFDTQASTFYNYVYDLGDDFVTREDKYTNCWNFYRGAHWDKPTPEGIDQIVINYCKVFSKKMRRFTFRNDWTISFSDEQKALGHDKFIVDVWKRNDLHDLTSKCADYASIFGDFYIYVKYIPKTDKEDGYIKLTALDPRTVFPFYNGLTGEMDQCVVLFPYNETVLLPNGNMQTVIKWYREIHTKEKIFIQSAVEKQQMMVNDVQENPLGKILIVHGINQPVAGSFFGCSDIEDIVDSQKLLDEKVSDISDILDYHAAPVTVIFGAKAKQLEKGANKVWSGLPANAKVENLASAGNIPEAMKFIEFIKQTMHEISNVTEESLGGGKAISNTSAVALSIDFEPMIELAEDKRFYFTKALKAINELIIDIGINKKLISAGTLKGLELYNHGYTFGSLLPRDRQADLQDIQTEMNLGLETPKGALERLGERNVKAKLEEIDEYAEEKSQKALENAQFMAMQKSQAGADTGMSTKAKAESGDKDMKKAADSINKNPKTHGEQVAAEQVKKKITS